MTSVVVGNGPSLTADQLDYIKEKGWYSVGVNRVYKIYDQTAWRPDIVFMADYMRSNPAEIASDCEIHLKEGYPVHARGDLGRQIPHKIAQDLVPFFDCSHSISCEPEDNWHPKSHIHPEYGTNEWHLPSLCKAGGTLFIAMQHCVMQDFKRIVLIGCDGEYTRDEKTNHFVPDYLPPEVERTPEQARMDNYNQAGAHKVAARECKVRGIKVYNASIHTVIPVYERIELAQIE